jgi:hypothetical protein
VKNPRRKNGLSGRKLDASAVTASAALSATVKVCTINKRTPLEIPSSNDDIGVAPAC